MSARIGHIAGGPDTKGSGPAGAIDSGKPPLVDLTTEAGKQTIGVRNNGRADEHGRPRNHSAISELDAGQPVVFDQQPRDLATNDPHPARLELDFFGRAQIGGVNEEHDVLEPLPHQLCMLD